MLNNINNNNIKQNINNISDSAISDIYRPKTKSLLLFILTISNIQESDNLKDITNSPDSPYWKQAF